MEPITDQFFQDLKTKILNAVKPLLTEDELAAFAADIRVSDYGVTSSSLKTGSLISLEITEDIDMDHPTVRFEDLGISEDRRGQGIGTAIIQAAVDFALQSGFEFNLSANPTEVETESISDPAYIAAQQRLIAYYGRLGMVDDGWGNMHVHINRVEDDGPTGPSILP